MGVLKIPRQWAPSLIASPLPLSSDHSWLGSTPKVNFSVKVTPACAADTEADVLVACGTAEHGFPPLVGHVCVCGGRVFHQILVVLAQQTLQRLLPVEAGEVKGGVVPHPAYEGDCWAQASQRWTAVR